MTEMINGKVLLFHSTERDTLTMIKYEKWASEKPCYIQRIIHYSRLFFFFLSSLFQVYFYFLLKLKTEKNMLLRDKKNKKQKKTKKCGKFHQQTQKKKKYCFTFYSNFFFVRIYNFYTYRNINKKAYFLSDFISI